jgi:hypothetical protein
MTSGIWGGRVRRLSRPGGPAGHSTNFWDSLLVVRSISARACGKMGFGYSYVLIRTAVEEKKVVALGDGAFDEDYVRNLADLFPVLFGGEDGIVAARQQVAGILAVEDGEAGAVDEFVIGAVVDEDDATGRKDGCGAGLAPAGASSNYALAGRGRE